MEMNSKIPHFLEDDEKKLSKISPSEDCSRSPCHFFPNYAHHKTFQQEPAVLGEEVVKTECLELLENVPRHPEKIHNNQLSSFLDPRALFGGVDETRPTISSSMVPSHHRHECPRSLSSRNHNMGFFFEKLDSAAGNNDADSNNPYRKAEVNSQEVAEKSVNTISRSEVLQDTSGNNPDSALSTDNVFISTDASIRDVLTYFCERPSLSELSQSQTEHVTFVERIGSNPSSDVFLPKEAFPKSVTEQSGAYKYLPAIDSFSPGIAPKKVVKKWKYSDARKLDGLTPTGSMTAVGYRARKYRDKVLHTWRKQNDEGHRPSRVKISDVKQIWLFASNSEASEEKLKASPNLVCKYDHATEEEGTNERCSIACETVQCFQAGNANTNKKCDDPCDVFQPRSLRISSKPLGLPLSWLCDEKDGEIDCTPVLEDIGKRTSTIVMGKCSSPTNSTTHANRSIKDDCGFLGLDVTDDSSESLLPKLRLTGLKSPRSPSSLSDSDASTIFCEVYPIRKARLLSEEFSPITPPGGMCVLDKLSDFHINSDRPANVGFLSLDKDEYLECDCDDREEEENDGSIRPLDTGLQIPSEIPKFILDQWKDKAISCSKSVSSTTSGPTSNVMHPLVHLTISSSSSSKSAEQKLRSLSYSDRITEIH